MQLTVRKLLKSDFLRSNTVFFIGTLAIGFLNYLYYPILGRIMPADSFGEVQTLFSLFGQTVIFLGVLGLVTINIVTNYGESEKGQRIISELEKFSLAASLLILILTVMISEDLKHFFRFGSAIPFILLAVALALDVPFTLRSAYLRGKQKFGIVSWIGVIAASSDLVFSIFFVLAGRGTTGAIAGLVVAQSIALWIVVAVGNRFNIAKLTRNSISRIPDLRLILPELRYTSLVLIGSLGITLFYSIDILIIKHYFSAHVAGLYAGVSTVGRVVFYVTLSISQVMMPAVKLSMTSAQNQQVLLKSLVLLLFIGGITWLVFALLPDLIVRILMGSKYLPYANLLPRLGFMILVVSIANLFVTYHLALRRYVVALIVIIGISATLILVSLHHDSPVAVINSLLIGSLTLLVLLSAWMAVSKVKNYLQA